MTKYRLGAEFEKRILWAIQMALSTKSWESETDQTYSIRFTVDKLISPSFISDNLSRSDLIRRFEMGYLDQALERMLLTRLTVDWSEQKEFEYIAVPMITKVEKKHISQNGWEYLVFIDKDIVGYYLEGEEQAAILLGPAGATK